MGSVGTTQGSRPGQGEGQRAGQGRAGAGAARSARKRTLCALMAAPASIFSTRASSFAR